MNTTSQQRDLQDIKVCVVGCGSIGSLHVELYANNLNPSCIGIVEVNMALHKDLLDKGYSVFSSIETSLTCSYDVYDICLPTFLHKDAIEIILSKTKSKIICEKPLVLNKSELVSLLKLAATIKERLVCAYVERFNDPFIQAKDWTKRNVGPYTMNFTRRTKKPLRQDWFSDPKKGGDVILDLGIHDIDASIWFSESKFKKVLSYKHIEDNEVLEVILQDGSVVRYEVGWDVPQDSEVGIINNFTITTRSDLFRYDSSKETVFADGRSSKVKPRFPYAYQSEIDAAQKLPGTINAAFPNFRHIEQTYAIIEALSEERKHE